MCGICGVVDWSESGDAGSLVKRMSGAMVHRGPDDSGIADFGFRIADFSNANHIEGRRLDERKGALAIGMRRLSIIDLEGGHQPIYNEAGDVAGVLNGEIYNFQALRNQLQDRGHTFRTRADSEVVVHAFEEWGPQSVERFEGMFAIAIWDGRQIGAKGEGEREKGRLFLARDRLGIKPLYYYAEHVQSPGVKEGHRTLDVGPSTRFLFASEVRALLASGLVPRRLSRPALESYLLFGSVGEPMTLVEDVYSLPPGHRLTIELGAASVPTPERYWTMAAGRRAVGEDLDRGTAAHTVRELLQQSVRKHLIADVPVGVFLSSGIDSTALAALASREASGVHTFTVAFPEKEFSEAAVARRTAASLGTVHDEVTLSGDDMLSRLSDAVAALDQPTMDGINTYFVSSSARQAGLKVALSGLGGDELFGGYQTFWRTAHFNRMALVAQRFPDGMKSMVAAAGSAAGRFSGRDAARKLSALWKQPQSLPDPFYFGRALFTPPQVADLLKTEPNGHRPLWRDWLRESAARAHDLDSFAAVSCMEAESYMVNTLLRDTDSMSMAHSLEVRVPFLDHPLVEFVTRLPRDVKFRKGRPKALLVDALRDLLPAEVVNQSKRGFTFPWAEWLRGPLKSKVDEGLGETMPALRDALNSDRVHDVWRSYLDGKTSWSRPWSLYVLNEWCKAHL